MIASKNTGATITTNYKIKAAQGAKTESRAYFVLEHAPTTCPSLPASGTCTFADIYLEVRCCCCCCCCCASPDAAAPGGGLPRQGAQLAGHDRRQLQGT